MTELPELSLIPLLGVKIDTGNGPKIVTFPILNSPTVDCRDVTTDFGNFASLFLKPQSGSGNDVATSSSNGGFDVPSINIPPFPAGSSTNAAGSSQQLHVSPIESKSPSVINPEFVINWDALGEIQRKQNECISLISKATVANNDLDNENLMFCDICGDRATGLHYGIISCEG